MPVPVIDILLSAANTPEFSHFISTFGYIGIFIWFISFDQITPIPNEISLLIIGYLAANGVFEPVIAAAVCLAGFLSVDLAYYFLSRTGSRWIKKLMSRFSESFLNSTKQKLQHQMPRTIIVLCFVPRMRFWNPILVGIMNLSFRRFLLYDSIGLALFTAVYITIGVVFHRSLTVLIAEMEIWRHVIFVAVLIIFAAAIIFITHKRKNREAPKRAG